MTGSANPWLHLPLERYEFHMSEVRQDEPLAELFGEALAFCRPRSLAILGIAGGNGLDRIDPSLTMRVVGVDINRSYLACVAERYRSLPGLELHRLDLAFETPAFAPVELVHAALLFEHAGTGRCLDAAVSLVAPGGHLSVVLQEPGEWKRNLGGQAEEFIRSLACQFEMLEPGGFRRQVEESMLKMVLERRCPVLGGLFWMGIFAKG
jgi:hypothetical protein